MSNKMQDWFSVCKMGVEKMNWNVLIVLSVDACMNEQLEKIKVCVCVLLNWSKHFEKCKVSFVIHISPSGNACDGIL
jgi:hypothetical protein